MQTKAKNSTTQILEELQQDYRVRTVLDAVIAPFFVSYEIIPPLSGVWRICGEIKLDNQHCTYHFSRTANVEITLKPQDLIQFQPKVKVNEQWMRQSPDWHCGKENALCWELAAHWKDKLTEISRKHPPFEDFVKYALSWCLESSVCLISRHWYAHTQNITTWPSEWMFWGHYKEGEKEYERRKRKKERKMFKRQHR